MGGSLGCQTLKFQMSLRAVERPAKARQTYCIVVPRPAFRHQYVATSITHRWGQNPRNGGQPKLRSGPPDPYRSMVMTDFPSPSGRSEKRQRPGFCAVPACPVRHRRHRARPGRPGAAPSLRIPDRRPSGAAARRYRPPLPPIVLAEPEARAADQRRRASRASR